MADGAETEWEKHIKQLKRRIECWREIILPINSILLWEKSWHPGLIFGITTTIFFLIWMMEPAFITIVSMSLLVLTLIDYLAPRITSRLCAVNGWTGQKEKKLNEICQNLSEKILQLQDFWQSMLRRRNECPKRYYLTLTACLIICIWIGSTINNLLVFYIAANAMLLLPGLRHKRRATRAITYVYGHLCHAKKS